MTRARPPAPSTLRDRGLRRLRRWTVTVAAASAGLVGLFAVLAVNSFPGHASASGSGATSTSGAAPASSSDASSSDDSQSAPAPVQPQPPPGGFFGGGRGGPMVVSGGS
ncbi:MAG TPA: hypothetical protein VFD01_22240 [Candidatus Dormibacteraeota bacterium]|nr:hypothetical protein [Candidatus Dormibacteraeota bacterium]